MMESRGGEVEQGVKWSWQGLLHDYLHKRLALRTFLRLEHACVWLAGWLGGCYLAAT